MTIYSGFSHWKWSFAMAMLVHQRVKWKKVNRDFYASRLSLWLTVRMTTIMDLLHLPSLAATLGEHWIHQPKAEWLSGREMKVDGKKDWVVSYLTYLWIYRIYRKNMKKRSVHLWSKTKNKRILLVSFTCWSEISAYFSQLPSQRNYLEDHSMDVLCIVHIYSWDKPRIGDFSGFHGDPWDDPPSLQAVLKKASDKSGFTCVAKSKSIIQVSSRRW